MASLLGTEGLLQLVCCSLVCLVAAGQGCGIRHALAAAQWWLWTDQQSFRGTRGKPDFNLVAVGCQMVCSVTTAGLYVA